MKAIETTMVTRGAQQVCLFVEHWRNVRIAIVSDIHGNLTAFEAVLADLRDTAPDLVLHGGDLAGPGSRPVEVVDRIRDLGWPGIAGNTDEMLFDPESLTRFAAGLPQLKPMFDAIAQMAAATCECLGEDRIAWLRALPGVHREGNLALVHASPKSLWRSPIQSAADPDLDSTYRPLGGSVAVYGHIHVPFVRELEGLVVANSGSVGQPYDGDRRACYLVVDEGRPLIRRVEYDVDRELRLLAQSALPHAEWIARTIRAAAPSGLSR